ncbi:SH3 domain-containing protein [Chlamydiota bacterium]
MNKIIFILFICLFTSVLLAQETDLKEESLSGKPDVEEVKEKNVIPDFPWAGEINANRVNVRSGGNINFEILCQRDKEDLVIVIDEKVDWYRIEPTFDSFFWIHKDYVDDEKEVTAYSVNVRSGPDVRYSINCQVEKGDKVDIIDEVDGWYKISAPQEASVWVHKDFIQYKMPYSEYKEKLDTEIADKIAQKQRKILLHEAEQFERKEFYKPLDEIVFDEIIEKYRKIVKEYPKTAESKVAEKRINLIRKKYADSLDFIKSEKKLRKKDEKKNPKKQSQQKVIMEGVLEDFGVVVHRPGTYKLVRGRKKICILKSGEKNLNPLIHQKVRVLGAPINSDFGIPAYYVEEINIIE